MGSPSGIEATASAIPVSIISTISRPAIIPEITTTTAIPRLTHISQLASWARRCSSGVSSSTVCSTREEIFPSSVCMPVATTTASPEPLVSAVPLKSILVLSASAVFSSTTSGDFSTGRDSPVRTDSSACNFEEVTRRRSAVIMSPPSRMTISPGTRSLAGISETVPFLRTRELTLPSFRKASMERTPLSSVTKPIRALMTMTMPIAMPSTWSPNINATSVAINKNNTIKFLNWLISMVTALCALTSRSMFRPKTCRLFRSSPA